MVEKRMKNVSIEGAMIGFRNFSGAEGPYNKAGDRNFAIFLDRELAEAMADDGWNVRWPKEREMEKDEEDARNPHIQVSFTFKNYPPKIVIISDGVTTKLDEESVDMLDWAEIEMVDVEIRPYQWTVNGQSGIKAYLQAIYVTLQTDEFSKKYGVY